MPAWTRTTIPRKVASLAVSTADLAETDHSYIQEIAAADEQKGWLFIEAISGTGAEISVRRNEGARPDRMREVTPALGPFTTIGPHGLDWPTGPAGAVRKLVISGKTSSGSGSVTFEVDEVFRTVGG